ncbi:MAG: RNA methyltransferase [Ruminococcaceae bacterium]|nr:RNA methyltransferase [Oscillospiraceae bacterium]
MAKSWEFRLFSDRLRDMEQISSRKNKVIMHLRKLGAERAYRDACGEYLCDGEKLLREALAFGAKLGTVLWVGEPTVDLKDAAAQFAVPAELMEYVSPLKNSKGPLFSVRIPEKKQIAVRNAILLENVQDPGNVGTVIRTANALGIEAVLLVGDCADAYNFKTVRAAMGALFRQELLSLTLETLPAYLKENNLRLYGAALTDQAQDIRNVDLEGVAVAIGSEGRGLSKDILDICDGQVIIPMLPHSESLNAAVAAAIAMWEMNGGMLPCPR